MKKFKLIIAMSLIPVFAQAAPSIDQEVKGAQGQGLQLQQKKVVSKKKQGNFKNLIRSYESSQQIRDLLINKKIKVPAKGHGSSSASQEMEDIIQSLPRSRFMEPTDSGNHLSSEDIALRCQGKNDTGMMDVCRGKSKGVSARPVKPFKSLNGPWPVGGTPTFGAAARGKR